MIFGTRNPLREHEHSKPNCGASLAHRDGEEHMSIPGPHPDRRGAQAHGHREPPAIGDAPGGDLARRGLRPQPGTSLFVCPIAFLLVLIFSQVSGDC